jgi:hypothetical protein
MSNLHFIMDGVIYQGYILELPEEEKEAFENTLRNVRELLGTRSDGTIEDFVDL